MKRLILIALCLLTALALAAPQELGNLTEDSSVVFYWNTYDDSGASVTRATDGTVKVRRDDATDCTAGVVTDGEDDPATGIHKATLDLSGNANLIVAHDYIVYVEGAVIDGDTINAVLARFSIQKRYDSQTGDSFARIGAAGVGLTAVALADATSDAVIADAVWNAATATYGGAGSYGLLAETNLDATISSRLAPAGTLALVTLCTTTTTVTNLTNWHASVTDWTDGGRLDLIIDAILLDTGTDGVVVAAASKTGYALSAAGLTAVENEVLDALSVGHLGAGSIGLFISRVDALISTRATPADVQIIIP